MDSLPPELLTHILTYLDQRSRLRCALLNCHWHQLVTQAVGQVGIDFRSSPLRGKIQRAALCAHISKKQQGLRHLTLRSVKANPLDPASNPLTAVVATADGCHRLQSLRLLNCYDVLSIESLGSLLTHCPCLHRLEVDQGWTFADPAACTQLFLQLLSRLTNLRLPDPRMISGSFNAAMLTSWFLFRRLACLDLEVDSEARELDIVTFLV